MLDVGPFGILGPDRDPHRPHAVQQRRGDQGRARGVDRVHPGEGVRVQPVGVQPGRLVPEHDGLQADRGQDPPAGGRFDLPGKPAGVVQVPAQPGPDGLDPVQPQVEPQLERAEPAAERDAPVLVLGHLAVDGGPEVGRVRRHDPDQVGRVGDVQQRAVQHGAHPLVRVPAQRVRALDALDQPAHLRQQQRRARHGRVDVHPHPVALGHRDDLGQRVYGRGPGGADVDHDGRRAPAATSSSMAVASASGRMAYVTGSTPTSLRLSRP